MCQAGGQVMVGRVSLNEERRCLTCASERGEKDLDMMLVMLVMLVMMEQMLKI